MEIEKERKTKVIRINDYISSERKKYKPGLNIYDDVKCICKELENSLLEQVENYSKRVGTLNGKDCIVLLSENLCIPSISFLVNVTRLETDAEVKCRLDKFIKAKEMREKRLEIQKQKEIDTIKKLSKKHGICVEIPKHL